MQPVTALGAGEPRVVEVGAYRIAERFDVALGSVAVRRGQDLTALAAAAGVPLPGPGRALDGPVYSAFWVTPEMWFVEAAGGDLDIAAALKAIFGDAASVTEQTDAWVRFDLSAPDLGAPDLVALLERLSNVDLARVPVGFASRTVIDHLGCYLIKRGVAQVTLYGPRSSAGSLLHALEVAAASVS